MVSATQAETALAAYATGDISGVRAIAARPPHYIPLDSDTLDGSVEIVNFLLTDSVTKTYDLSWQRRGSRPHFLGQIKASANGWVITYVERQPLTDGESTEFSSYQDAAFYLYQEWSNVREARKRQAVRELHAA